MNTVADFDVVVAGNGIAALATACLFAHLHARVALAAVAEEAAVPAGAMELRNYAISPASQQLLQTVGVWTALERARIGQIDALSVWDANSSGKITFTSPPIHSGAMGWIVERQNLASALMRTLKSRAVPFLGAAVTDLTCGPPAQLSLADGRRIRARLVVGADGSGSVTRVAANIGFKRSRYDQRAYVANVLTELAHNNTARQRFLRTGPLAFLPLADPRQSSIVWSATDDLACELDACDEPGFAAVLERAFDRALGRVISVSERLSYNLERAQAEAWVRGACALIGDAAHVVHPLAGQGLNLGLMDALALVECIGAPSADAAWPRASRLRRYERWRKSEALALTVVTDGLKRLFAYDKGPICRARGLGMRIVDQFAPLNHWLADQASASATIKPQRIA